MAGVLTFFTANAQRIEIGLSPFAVITSIPKAGPTFRNAYKKSRCIVPIDGYFEWKTGADKKKQPFFIRNETAPLYLAGLCEPSTRSLTIVTCEAEAKLRDIHNRRPIALSPDEIQTWLDPKSTQIELLMAIRSSEMDKVKADMVSTKVNSVANDGPELLELIAS